MYLSLKRLVPRPFILLYHWFLGYALNLYFRFPSARLKVIGITGTNGKGITAVLIKDILTAGGNKVGLVTSMYYNCGDHNIPADLTTPPVQKLLLMMSKAADLGCNFFVLEVTSHAIAQKRLGPIKFAAKVFTNFSTDHLDYHKTEKDYLATKLSFFNQPPADFMVTNSDDPVGRMIDGEKVMTFGIRNEADIRADKIQLSWGKTTFEFIYKNEKVEVGSSLLGQFNVYNILAAISVGIGYNIELKNIIKSIDQMHQIPGRFELIRAKSGANIIIDYANNTEALEVVFSAVKTLGVNKIIGVFGCPGNRKRFRRVRTGQAFAKYSDYCIITNDNPRAEDPLAIIKIIEQGFIGFKTQYEVIPDRRWAIAAGLRRAVKDDVVLIIGKGHELFQEVSGKKIFFNDKQTVLEFLQDA